MIRLELPTGNKGRGMGRFCTPRRGWYCTYAAGHLGECDAWPEWWNWFDRRKAPTHNDKGRGAA